MSYIDDINLKAAIHKTQSDLDTARRNVVASIVSRSHKVFNGPASIEGCVVKSLELHCNRANILFTDGTHLTVESDRFSNGELDFTEMDTEDAKRLHLVSPGLLSELVEKEREASIVRNRDKLVEDLETLVHKLGKDLVLKLLGAS